MIREGGEPLVEKGIELLTTEETQEMNRRRAWVAQYPGFFGDLTTIDGKLQWIDAILKDEKAIAGGTYTLQTIGVVLGDAVAQSRGMRWYMIDTNAGRGPGIGVPGTPVKVLPVNFFSDQLAEGNKPAAREAFEFFGRLVDQGLAHLPTAS